MAEKARAASESQKPKKVTLAIEFAFDTSFLKDPTFRMKLLFLGLMAVLFVLTAVMLQRSNIHLSDLFDAPRFAYHITKLWSPAFLLFLALYGLTLATATYYGHKLQWLPALFPLVLALILGAAMGMWMPPFLQAFLALSLSVGAAGLLATRFEKLTLGSAWQTAGRALMLFVLLALILTYARINANKDFYFDQMLSGATQLAGGEGGATGGLSASTLTPLLTAAIGSVSLDAAFYRSVLTQNDLQAMEPALVNTCGQAGNVSLISSGVCQNLFNTNYPVIAAAGGGLFAPTLYNATIDRLVALSPQIKQKLSDRASQSLSGALTQAQATVGNQTTGLQLSSSLLRDQMLSSIPPLKVAYDYLPLLIAMSVASILYAITYLSRLISALAAWGLTKVL